MKRTIFKTALSLYFTCLLCANTERPNIVVIFADDMGFSDIGCFGSEINTPNLDRLAMDGLRFTQFYNTGRCCPSRASILTGLYSHQAGIGHMAGDTGLRGYRDRLSFNAVTLAEVLGSSGYHTIMTGKWHLGWRDEGSPTARGFQHFYGTRGYIDSYFTVIPRTEIYLNEKVVIPTTETPINHLYPDKEWYTTDVFTDYALHFIDEVRKKDDEPFFLYLAHNAPHFPLHAKTEDVKKYRGKYREGWQHFREQRLSRLRDMGILDSSWPLSKLDVRGWGTLTDEQRDDMDFKMALFAAIIDRLDQNVGRVVEHLRKIGELDNTLLLFVSDNGGTRETGLFGIKGENNTVANYDQWSRKGGWSSSYGQGWANLSNVPFRRYKRENHEGGISTPFIIHWPKGISSTGELRHQPTHLIDLMPTFVEVARAKYPTNFKGESIQPMEGQSLVPYLNSKKVESRTLFWEHEGNRAVRVGDWKLVASHRRPWELYAIDNDRSELRDLAHENSQKLAELKAKWEAWASRVGVRDPDYIKRARASHKRGEPHPLKLVDDPSNLAISAKVNFSTPRVGRDHDDSIRDGLLPGSSGDKDTVHRSWWPRKGSKEWVQYRFSDTVEVDCVRVYWFHDHPNGGCKVPESWNLSYLKDKKWHPVEVKGEFGLVRDTFNELCFDAVRTDALRLEVQLQSGASAGIHEWRVEALHVDSQ